MLSSFFSKSKPISFIVVILYVITFFVIAYYKKGFVFDSTTVLMFFGGLFLYVFSMLLLHQIIQENDLTQNNTYGILLFAFLTAILPNSLVDTNIIVANLFVLVGIKRVLSLRNQKFVKAKILEASIAIALASLTYFWSIGFILLIFVAILYFQPEEYRNWIIPFIGIGTVYIFATCYTLIFYNSFFLIRDYLDPVSFSFGKYWNQQQFFSIGVISICILFFFSVFLIKFRRKSVETKGILKLIIAALVISIAIVFIAPDKNTSEMLFLVSPLAIIGTTYIELGHAELVKEINIWVFLLLPFTILLF